MLRPLAGAVNQSGFSCKGRCPVAFVKLAGKSDCLFYVVSDRFTQIRLLDIEGNEFLADKSEITKWLKK